MRMKKDLGLLNWTYDDNYDRVEPPKKDYRIYSFNSRAAYYFQTAIKLGAHSREATFNNYHKLAQIKIRNNQVIQLRKAGNQGRHLNEYIRYLLCTGSASRSTV